MNSQGELISGGEGVGGKFMELVMRNGKAVGSPLPDLKFKLIRFL